MNLAFNIAKRYLFSKKSTNAINIISFISMAGMMVCTAAFILILSVFNGFEGLVISLYDSFYPDVKIEAAKGKTFPATDSLIRLIEDTEGVTAVSLVLEENAILTYGTRQSTATVKGVDENYTKVTGLDTSMIYGDEFMLKKNGDQFAILGSGIDQALQVSLRDPINRLSIYMPRRGRSNTFFPGDEFRKKEIMAWGVFAIQDDFDNRYIFVPLEFTRDMLNYSNDVSALEIKVASNKDQAAVRKSLKEMLGEDFNVLSKYEQNKFLYQIMNIEKLAVYFILSFVFLIVAFNMIGSLSMIVIDKKRDISILKTMGATNGLIKRIFMMEGILQSSLAVIIGFSFAIILLLLQQNLGLIQIQGSGTFVIQYYPVKMKLTDFINVAVIVMVISVVASYFPAARAAKQTQILEDD